MRLVKELEGNYANDILKNMGLKAGLLAEGIYFPKKLLNELQRDGKTMDGTGLFRYGDKKTAPNEIILDYNGKQQRIEVRQKNDSNSTNFTITNSELGYKLEDKLTGNTFSISFPKIPSYMNEQTSSGKFMKDVMKPMGSDFLRLYPDMRCDYAIGEDRCRFCGGVYKFNIQKIQDIVETLKRAKQDMKIKGIFMSTGAFTDKKRTEFYAQVLKVLRKELPIGQIVFALAPQTTEEQVKKLYYAGDTKIMLSYNMEAFDPNRWDINSPLCLGLGKARTSREFYFQAYDKGVRIGGRGNLKSNFVIGLESIESLNEGASYLAKKGIFSSGTVFYPTPGSIWSNQMHENPDFSPIVEEFNNDATRREFIVQSYLTIGDIAMKHNLDVPWTKASRISGLEWEAREYLQLE